MSAPETGPEIGLMVTPSLQLVRRLGGGGMGDVWLADHRALHTQVVVKFITHELVTQKDAVERFAREAVAASQVKSPHVVQVLDHGVMEGGVPYIVMEYVEGRDLGAHIEAHGKLPPAEVVAIVTQLARALTKAHERGIIHRDIKPSNVFLCDAGDGALFVKLLDFGIAKGAAVPMTATTTRTGSFLGTPFYMSPEQLVGSKDLDARSDLWSVGVVAFEALTGSRPFGAETVAALALKIHHEALPRPTEVAPELPPLVDAWFFKACARPPAERFASAKELAEGLAKALGDAVPVSAEAASRAPSVTSSPYAATVRAPSGREEPGTNAGLGVSSRLQPPMRSMRAVAAAALGVGVLAAVGGIWGLRAGDKRVGSGDAMVSESASGVRAERDSAAAWASPSGSAAATSSATASASASASASGSPFASPLPSASLTAPGDAHPRPMKRDAKRAAAAVSASATASAAPTVSAAPAVSSAPVEPKRPMPGSEDDIK